MGRVVLPIELRKALDFDKDEAVEIFINNEASELIIRAAVPKCRFCYETENVISFKDKAVCQSCVDELCNIAVN